MHEIAIAIDSTKREKDDSRTDHSLQTAFKYSQLCFKYGIASLMVANVLFLGMFWLGTFEIALAAGGGVAVFAGLTMFIYSFIGTKAQAGQCVTLTNQLLVGTALTPLLVMAIACIRYVYEKSSTTGLDDTTNGVLFYFVFLMAFFPCLFLAIILLGCRAISKNVIAR